MILTNIFSKLSSIRYCYYLSGNCYSQIVAKSPESFKEKIEEYKKDFISFGINLGSTVLIGYDIDGHNEEEKKTLEDRKNKILNELKSMKISPLIDKSGRGYHIWIVFDEIPTQAQRDYIHTRIELVVPGIEGRIFDFSKALRLPGRYKNTNQYSYNGTDNTILQSYKDVETFFDSGINKLSEVDFSKKITVISSKKGVQKVKAPKTREEFVNGTPASTTLETKIIEVTKENFKALKAKWGVVATIDGLAVEKKNCIMKDVISDLRIIKDTPNLGLSIEDFQGSEVNGYIRNNQTNLSIFCARNSEIPLIKVVPMSTRRSRSSEGDHEESVSRVYTNIIRSYNFVRDISTDTFYTNGRMLDDSILAEISVECERLTGKMNTKLIENIIWVVAEPINGREEVIQSLPKWDGKDRIAELAKCFIVDEKCEVQENFSMYRKLEYFLMRAIKKWQFGTQCPVLTLASDDQQIGKSTFAAWFGHSWDGNPYYNCHTDTPVDPSNKDSRLNSTRVMVQELGELGTLSRRDTNDVKNFLTLQEIFERPPYGHIPRAYKPMAVFIATANLEDGMFNDVENRRFLVLYLKSISLEYRNIDRKQLLAQALALCESTPEKLELTQIEKTAQKQENHQYEKEELITTRVRANFMVDPDNKTLTPYNEIVHILETTYPNMKVTSQALSKAMIQIGAGKSIVKSVKATNGKSVSQRGYIGISRIMLA